MDLIITMIRADDTESRRMEVRIPDDIAEQIRGNLNSAIPHRLSFALVCETRLGVLTVPPGGPR